MRNPYLILNYAKLSDIDLDFKAELIEQALTGNTNFPVTTPTLATLTSVREAYREALNRAAGGERTQIAIKKQIREDLVAILRQLAINIASLANGDRAKLVSSGFDLASDGEAPPPLSAITGFTLTDGLNSGEVRLSVKRIPQAVSYVHEYTAGPVTAESKWISKISTSREMLFTGLQSGIRISARVTAIGRKNQEVQSNILTRVVQ